MNKEAPKTDYGGVLARIFVSPGERRLRLVWRLLVHILLIAILFLSLSAIFGAILAFVPGWERSASLVLAGAQVINFLAFTLSVLLARHYLDRRSIASLGLLWNRHSLKDLLIGFLIPGMMMGLIYLLEWGAGWLKIEGFAWQFDRPPQVAIQVLAMLGVFVTVGWQEELLSRGYWLQNLAEGLTMFWGMLISALLFALLHILNPHMSLAAGVGLFMSGLFLGYAYLRTRQLWLAIGLHTGWNFFEGTVFGFSVSGLDNLGPLIRQSVTGPELWTGGRFGPEAGLVLVPALLVGVILVTWYTRLRNKKEQG